MLCRQNAVYKYSIQLNTNANGIQEVEAGAQITVYKRLEAVGPRKGYVKTSCGDAIGLN